MYKWIHQIVFQNLPFSFVDQEENRANSKLKPTCSKTLKLAMDVVTREVEAHVAKILPNVFALIFDGWSAGDTHFVAIFASFMQQVSVFVKGVKEVKKTLLLAMSPMEDETRHDADMHKLFIISTLTTYGKKLDNVCALIGDNCSTDKSLAAKCNIPLIGCFSHILNLAVKKFLFEKNQNMKD